MVNPDLEALRRNVVEDIKGSLYLQAQVASQSVSCQIQIATTGIRQLIPLSPDVRIIQLNPIDILVNYPTFPINGGRGFYDPKIGKTILCQGKWCEKTLIHETLHSLSFSSVRIDLRRTYLGFFEGLTEFFAGYVMFCRHRDCYEAWKRSSYSLCSVSYVPSVRLWAGFCRFIPIAELVKTYFWDGTPDWEARCRGFLDAIHQAGYPQFDDFTRRPIPTVEDKILEECLENFGREEFRSIYEGPLGSTLNFDEMLRSCLPLP
jgi:hypothetical protein